MRAFARRDLLSTYLATAVVTAAGVLVYRLAASRLGESGFTEVALIRRVLALLQTAVIMGLPVPLTRSVARFDASQEGESPVVYLEAAALCLVVSLTVALSLLTFGRSGAASLLYGEASRTSLVAPLGTLLLGNSVHVALYQYLLGRNRMTAANSLQLLNLGIIPIAAFAFLPLEAPRILWVMGASVLTVSLLASSVVLIGALGKKKPRLWPKARHLVYYGLPRVPGDFALAAVLALPALVAAHFMSVREAGFIAFGSTLLTLAGTALTPISTLLLPHASRMFKSGRHDELQATVSQINKLILSLAIPAVALAELGMPLLLRVIFKVEAPAAVRTVRIMLLGTVPYALYVSLRSVVDASDPRALTARLTMMASVVFGVSAVVSHRFGADAWGIPASSALSLCVLGALSLREARRAFARAGADGIAGAGLSETSRALT